ncbi:hypothetical protein BV22DRAFT_909871 [Leucogyrophana mollusca]|uniref:Uncharacterized protein n=1 Tax=Leucogyrophana mollusca TaxID=85980 RepID=A0ACB8AYI1_9AGAM|nr:hypothetical protein BV22DRAFT_909871 [Leucogyrophana mollusca]
MLDLAFSRLVVPPPVLRTFPPVHRTEHCPVSFCMFSLSIMVLSTHCLYLVLFIFRLSH